MNGVVFVSACWSVHSGASHRMSCPLQFLSPQLKRGAPSGLSTQNHHSGSRLHQRERSGEGRGDSGSACITVTVGNCIRQIKSSVYLCGSGDSGGGARRGWDGGDVGGSGVRE